MTDDSYSEILKFYLFSFLTRVSGPREDLKIWNVLQHFSTFPLPFPYFLLLQAGLGGNYA